jgi:hypothetical protein
MTRQALFCAVLLPLVCTAISLRAESNYKPQPEDMQWQAIEAGIEYTTWSFEGVKNRKAKEGESPWKVPPIFAHILRVDLDDTGLSVRSLRPLGHSEKLEKIVDIFRTGGVDVRAALNGDYFSFAQAEKNPLGLHASGGQLLWFPANTTSIAVDGKNRLHMDRYTVNQTISGEGLEVHVSGANRKANKQESVIYSGYYLKKTIPQGSCTGLLLHRTSLGPMINAEVQVTVAKIFPSRAAQRLKPLELALLVCGDARPAAKALPVGTSLTIKTAAHGFEGVMVEAISGGPRILRDGQIVKEMSQEGFTLPLRLYIPQPHPRAAVGISSSGKTLYLLAGEGRVIRSAGLSSDDTAALFKAAGASDAMLFDGGGSVALLGPDGFYNKPHNRSNRSARSMANAIAIIRRKKSGGKASAKVK